MQLYLSVPHSCSYLPENEAATLFVDPDVKLNSEHYGYLLEAGFRRSGDMVYRPKCPDCQACISIRIPVDKFLPRRIQRRIQKKMGEVVSVIEKTPEFNQEHFGLFRRYIESRHDDGEMSDMSEEGYIRFLGSACCNTRFVEFRIEGQLIGVAVVDRIPQGLSAVYTFFDPDFSHLSPGVYAILWQINECRRLGLPWLYLGYWIEGCRKMSYKTDYRPLQAFNGESWEDQYEIPFSMVLKPE